MNDSFAALVQRSLEVLRCEQPDAFAALASRLRDRRLRFVIDARPLDLSSDGKNVTVGPPGDSAIAELEPARRPLVDLLRGRTNLLDELARERIGLTGSAAALWELHEALLDYLRGAVRCPSFPSLLSEFENGPRGTNGE